MYQYVAVALGGAIGASLRFGLVVSLPNTGFPWPILLANCLGSFAIGLSWGAAESIVMSPMLKLFIITGLLGALTTFSTFSLDAILLIQEQRWLAATAYVLANLAGCLLLTWMALSIARRIWI